MRIGYGRVSKQIQNESLQRDALEKAECGRIFIDKGVSGAKFDRKELTDLLAYARAGDTVVVWKLDRLGRSLQELIRIVNTLNEQGVEFISLTEQIDTSTPGGKLLFHIMGALAQFERDLIIERTKAGLDAARARGHKGGRKKEISEDKIALAQMMYEGGKHTVASICKATGMSSASFYRYVNIKEDTA